MVISPWKALLFIAGGTAAAAAAGYVTGAFDGVFAPAPPMVAALPGNTAPATGGATPATTDVPLPGAGTPSEAPAAETPADGTGGPVADAKVYPPTFDVLRVEKDGSVVIAGKSAPKASVEIINGTAVIAQTVSTRDGDFAVVLDEPLKPGDYQIVLRATTPENVAATSVETALVSVPDSADGEVLALVEEPGKPSKLITVPEGGDDLADLPEGEIAAEPQESDVALADPSSGVASDAATGEGTTAKSAAAADVAGSEAPAGGDAAGAPANQDVATVPAGEQDAAAPAGEDVAVLDEPATPGEAGVAPLEPAATPSPATDAAGEQAVASADAGTVQPSDSPAQATAESAVKTPDNAPAAGTDAPAETLAGSATPPASPETASPAEPNEQQVALATPTEPAVDRAVQPAPRTTAPAPSAGQPMVRVEAVEIEGRKVFVAGQASPRMVVRVYANEYLLGETVASEAGRFLIETERDLPVGDYIIRADLLDDGGRKVVARAAVPFQREAGESIAAVAPPVSEAPAASAPQPNAEAAPTQTAASDPAQVAKAGAGESPAAEMPASAPKPSATEDVATASPPEKPAAAAGMQASDTAPTQEKMAAADPAASPEPDEPTEITSPKLQSVQGAVIIRRGDTLWRISRRVYGRGVRYSTIYVANQDQIADPNRIWPGQVFRVPDKSTEGEAADLEAMGEQMTTVE